MAHHLGFLQLSTSSGRHKGTCLWVRKSGAGIGRFESLHNRLHSMASLSQPRYLGDIEPHRPGNPQLSCQGVFAGNGQADHEATLCLPRALELD